MTPSWSCGCDPYITWLLRHPPQKSVGEAPIWHYSKQFASLLYLVPNILARLQRFNTVHGFHEMSHQLNISDYCEITNNYSPNTNVFTYNTFRCLGLISQKHLICLTSKFEIRIGRIQGRAKRLPIMDHLIVTSCLCPVPRLCPRGFNPLGYPSVGGVRKLIEAGN